MTDISIYSDKELEKLICSFDRSNHNDNEHRAALIKEKNKRKCPGFDFEKN